MSKEITPLEALEELKFQVGNITYHTHDLQITTFKVRDSGLFETIETALKRLETLDEEKTSFDRALEKKLKALNIISQNFKLVGNCLHAKNKYAESGWVFVKEVEDEEEHNAWKEVLLCQQKN